jgi:hypothetical protein
MVRILAFAHKPAELKFRRFVTGTPPFSDPPPSGGYTYEDGNDFAYPFYWNSGELADGLIPCTKDFPIETINTLKFQDCPGDPLLPKGVAAEFTTSLVGILPSGIPSAPPLLTWNWETTFAGLAFGIGGVSHVSQTKSIFPIDPNSGGGGVTITSINGVPQIPPTVSCTTTPSILWPPYGEAVSVTVSGVITPGTSGLVSGGTTYAVIDEYSQVQPSGSIALGAGGSYSFGISLIAARKGSDQDGRTYTIMIGSKDTIGNVGSCSAVVTVPHDQR